MEDEREDEMDWTRRSVLEMGVAPAITGAMLDGTEREPGTLRKVE